MAIIETTRPVPLGAIATLRVVNLFDSMRTAFSQWRSARATETALLGLSNAQLQDIGIERGQIHGISLNTFGRP